MIYFCLSYSRHVGLGVNQVPNDLVEDGQGLTSLCVPQEYQSAASEVDFPS